MRIRFFSITNLVVIGLLYGCGDFGQSLQPGIPGLGDQGDSSDSGDSTPDDGVDAVAPVVGLTASNPTPTLNETVILTCLRIDGSNVAATFAFLPRDGRLVIDATRGTARFIVDASDLNSALTFTCTGRDDNGTGRSSNAVTVFPTG